MRPNSRTSPRFLIALALLVLVPVVVWTVRCRSEPERVTVRNESASALEVRAVTISPTLPDIIRQRVTLEPGEEATLDRRGDASCGGRRRRRCATHVELRIADSQSGALVCTWDAARRADPLIWSGIGAVCEPDARAGRLPPRPALVVGISAGVALIWFGSSFARRRT
jgi:hypothetical protein